MEYLFNLDTEEPSRSIFLISNHHRIRDTQVFTLTHEPAPVTPQNHAVDAATMGESSLLAAVLTCNVGAPVLIRVLFFNLCFNLLLHLGHEEVRLAGQRGHVVDDVGTADLDERERAELPLLREKQTGGMMAKLLWLADLYAATFTTFNAHSVASYELLLLIK